MWNYLTTNSNLHTKIFHEIFFQMFTFSSTVHSDSKIKIFLSPDCASIDFAVLPIIMATIDLWNGHSGKFLMKNSKIENRFENDIWSFLVCKKHEQLVTLEKVQGKITIKFGKAEDFFHKIEFSANIIFEGGNLIWLKKCPQQNWWNQFGFLTLSWSCNFNLCQFCVMAIFIYLLEYWKVIYGTFHKRMVTQWESNWNRYYELLLGKGDKKVRMPQKFREINFCRFCTNGRLADVYFPNSLKIDFT